MSGQTVFVPVDTLRAFMHDVFLALGVPEQEAAISADVLITSDLRGIESHGVGRLKMYYDRIRAGVQQAKTELTITQEGPTTATIDGGHGMGMVIAYRAMRLAIEKAKKYGLGAVAVRNSTHFGIAGYYALMAVQEGLIGMVFTNARPSIAPTFGVQPMLGTNPIVFGAPTDEACPFLFDGATSITQRGKIEVYEREGKSTPEGLVIDQEGRFATDSAAILRGLEKEQYALLPLGGVGEALGGYKGYGLATVVEILCAALQGGSYLHALTGLDEEGRKRPFSLGHFFLALDISQFIPLDQFRAISGDIVRQLRGSRPAPGHERIWTAGEKEFEHEAVVAAQGVPVNAALQRNLATMRDDLGLTQYEFPF